ncbi:MAG: calcium-binding protein, partial [Acidobacteriota bacterium]
MRFAEVDAGGPGARWLSCLLALSLAAIILIVPGPAEGSTLKSSFSGVDYDAVAGETNQVTVARSGPNYVFNESGGVAIVATAPCVNLLANVAFCPVAGIDSIDVSLLDMNDTASYDASIVAPIDTINLTGGPGNDTLLAEGPTGGDLRGNDGNDTITGGDGDEDVRANAGNDTVVTGVGDDLVFDGPGDDIVSTGPGRDRLIDDAIANGTDVLDGGEGLGDSMDSRSRTGSLSMSLNGVADDGEAGEGDNLIGIEQIDSGSGNDTLTAGSDPVVLRANDGDDVITGGPGPDSLDGGSDDDTVDGGGGNDFIDGADGSDQLRGNNGDDEFESGFFDRGADTYGGGAGNDTISLDVDFLGRGVIVDLDGVADDGPVIPVAGIPFDNAGADIENLVSIAQGQGGRALPGDDILTGNGSANQIDGGPGNDQISGLGGPDELIGGPGDDELDGGNGIDGIEGDGGS